MEQNNFREFAKDIILLAEIHGKEMSDGIIGMYFKALSDYSIETVADALSRAVKECKWFPKPVELIELMQGKPIAIEDRAQVAVTKILDHLHTWGSTKMPDLADDPIALHLMSMRWPYGTWAADVLTSEIKWWTKEFIEAYRSHTAYDDAERKQIEGNPKLKEIASELFPYDLSK